MSPRARASCLVRSLAALAACAGLWAPGIARAQQPPVLLKVLQEYVEPQPRIGRSTGISLIGVVAERAPHKGVTLNADLLLPADHALTSDAPVCIYARSQDARFSFQGEAPPGLPRATTSGRVRVKAPVRPESAAFLRQVELVQFALLARLGACSAGPAAQEDVPTIIAMDPRPEDGADIAAFRVLLNAPEGRVSLAYGPKGGAKLEQPCLRSSVKEAGAFATECRVTLPAAERIEIEIRRHRFNNKPLVDRFDLIGPAAPHRG